ncbi:MAG: aminotransferase class IV [Phycisphaerae bacterium]
MTGLVYLNGALVEAEQARLSAFDAGLTHGAGLFETVRCYAGRAFRLDRHLARLRNSATVLGVPLPWDDGALVRAVETTLGANELRDARLRITLTPGPPTGEAAAPTLLVAATALERYPESLRQEGMTACVCDHKISPSDPLAGHKTVSYFPRLLGLRAAQRKKCGEALWFTTEHLLAEGSISNVFLVRDERLETPGLGTPVLPGVARGVVLECAAALGIEAAERRLTIEDLLSADEVFLTNTIMEVMPVCRVERHAVGGERVGEVTGRLAAAYAERVREECAAEG